MSKCLWYLAWEWINISLEYTVTSWIRFPKWFWVVMTVNLVSHPALMFLLGRFGHNPRVLFPAEATVVLLETALLYLFYRRQASLVRIAGISLLMNATSFATGLALAF